MKERLQILQLCISERNFIEILTEQLHVISKGKKKMGSRALVRSEKIILIITLMALRSQMGNFILMLVQNRCPSE